MTASSLAFGSYPWICENVARAACTLWSRGSWLGSLGFRIVHLLLPASQITVWPFCVLLFRSWFLCHTNPLDDTMLSSLLVRLRCLRTDQLTTDRALFAWFCFLFLCALFGFGCLFCCFFCFARWQQWIVYRSYGSSLLPCFFSLFWLNRNVPRLWSQSVSYILYTFLPLLSLSGPSLRARSATTEEKKNCVPILFSSLLYAHCRHDWCCNGFNSVNLQNANCLSGLTNDLARAIWRWTEKKWRNTDTRPWDGWALQKGGAHTCTAEEAGAAPHQTAWKVEDAEGQVEQSAGISGWRKRIRKALHREGFCAASHWALLDGYKAGEGCLIEAKLWHVEEGHPWSDLFFRPTPSWLSPGRSTCSILCCKLGLID